MTDQTPLRLSTGRDYRVTGRYEFCLFRGEEVVAREGCFKSSATAKRAGLKAAAKLAQAEG